MRSDTAFFSAADISRRFLAGLASDLLSAAAAAFGGGGEEERRDVERAFGADAPRICSTSVKALISAWRRSISLWRSAIACAISLMPVESSGPAMGMSNTNAGFLSPGRVHGGGSAKRRAAAAWLPPSTCCHTFRATGITAYLSNGGTLEHAQQIAGHASPKTTKLYDRTADTVTADEIERIVI